MKISKTILPIIVISQFLSSSVWFAGNGVMDSLVESFMLPTSALPDLTSAVQFGFISGTLMYALANLADRFPPSLVFFLSAVLAALFNLGMVFDVNTLNSLILLRFATGFFLAGIYPVGMKIAADYFQSGLGRSLGYLVGALVVGTAFPHLLNTIAVDINWTYVVYSTSGLAVVGGLLILSLVPKGPYQKPALRIDPSQIFKVFRFPRFRQAAFGYFGHMWELYAAWTFIPLILEIYRDNHNIRDWNLSLMTFTIIGIGGISCVIGGYISERWGPKNTATLSLSLSALCCMLCPLFFLIPNGSLFYIFLLFWGMVIVADSPLFSTIVAHNAPDTVKGTALTIVNCIGFTITIIAIQVLAFLIRLTNESTLVYVVLAIGPVLGVVNLLLPLSNARALTKAQS